VQPSALELIVCLLPVGIGLLVVWLLLSRKSRTTVAPAAGDAELAGDEAPQAVGTEPGGGFLLGLVTGIAVGLGLALPNLAVYLWMALASSRGSLASVLQCVALLASLGLAYVLGSRASKSRWARRPTTAGHGVQPAGQSLSRLLGAVLGVFLGAAACFVPLITLLLLLH
jgi:hypothetical protein